MSDDFTGALAHIRPAQEPQRTAPPPGVTLGPGRAWDEVLGDIPDVWGPSEITRQRRIAREQAEEQESNRRSSEEQRRRDAAKAAEYERTRPRTVEERVAALEAQVAKLTAPTSIAPKVKQAIRRGSTDLPPAA